jgi:transcriptional antiterminator NusG
VVDEVRPDRGRVRVMISVFGRPTPVELEFTQLEKI